MFGVALNFWLEEPRLYCFYLLTHLKKMDTPDTANNLLYDPFIVTTFRFWCFQLNQGAIVCHVHPSILDPPYFYVAVALPHCGHPLHCVTQVFVEYWSHFTLILLDSVIFVISLMFTHLWTILNTNVMRDPDFTFSFPPPRLKRFLVFFIVLEDLLMLKPWGCLYDIFLKFLFPPPEYEINIF